LALCEINSRFVAFSSESVKKEAGKNGRGPQPKTAGHMHQSTEPDAVSRV